MPKKFVQTIVKAPFKMRKFEDPHKKPPVLADDEGSDMDLKETGPINIGMRTIRKKVVKR
jgi:hypothetical protein